MLLPDPNKKEDWCRCPDPGNCPGIWSTRCQKTTQQAFGAAFVEYYVDERMPTDGVEDEWCAEVMAFFDHVGITVGKELAKGAGLKNARSGGTPHDLGNSVVSLIKVCVFCGVRRCCRL